jgi:hypothetical protein
MSDDTIKLGRDAWARLSRCACFADWIAVAHALAIGRAYAMKTAETNCPVGSRYNLAMGAWLKENGLDGISAQERYRALLVLENLPAIEKFRADLDPAKARRLNHPAAIWWRWQSAKALAGKTKPRRDHAQRSHSSKTGKPVYWPSEAIERAARAIHECRSNDTYIIARVALQAAIRGANDIAVLLDKSTAQRPACITVAQAAA